jgi:hypothetical protein
MSDLILTPSPRSIIPALIAAAGERAGMRFLEFFAANIRNPHTRRAYARAADEFLAWCASAGVPSIVWCKECGHQVEPDPAEMARRYGAETSVLEWRERLVCSRYSGRQIDMVATGDRR